MNLGTNLKKRRSEKGLTQAELAEIVGVTAPMINQIEHGVKIPSLPTAIEIAKALDTTIDALTASA